MKVLGTMPDESVHCVVTSPPYWGLRAYQTEDQIWSPSLSDENISRESHGSWMNCAHEWGTHLEQKLRGSLHGPNATAGNTLSGISDVSRTCGTWCKNCGAWKGELGLEPTPELYVQHMVEVFRDVRRVLQKDGTLWLNMGDSYAGSGKGIGSDGTAYGGDKQRTNEGSIGLPVMPAQSDKTTMTGGRKLFDVPIKPRLDSLKPKTSAESPGDWPLPSKPTAGISEATSSGPSRTRCRSP